MERDWEQAQLLFSSVTEVYQGYLGVVEIVQ